MESSESQISIDRVFQTTVPDSPNVVKHCAEGMVAGQELNICGGTLTLEIQTSTTLSAQWVEGMQEKLLKNLSTLRQS